MKYPTIKEEIKLWIKCYKESSTDSNRASLLSLKASANTYVLDLKNIKQGEVGVLYFDAIPKVVRNYENLIYNIDKTFAIWK